MDIQTLFSELITTNSWSVVPKKQVNFDLPKEIKIRYKYFPDDWKEFISNYQSVINQEETAWFLCTEDYGPQEEDSFRWNEWELLSLQSAVDDNDEVWQENIRSFWDAHLPVMMSVTDGYAYYAIRISDGAIVYGCEPEFEECSKVADSFSAFAEKVASGTINSG